MDEPREPPEQTPPEPGDLTPVSGGWTDVAPLAEHPPHERTATDEAALADWDRVAALPAFRAMIARKVRFVVAATVFFVAYYFALPVSVGYFPRAMDRRVLGPVNLAYLFALSQFFVAWLLAFVYVRVAASFDRMSRDILADVRNARGGR